MSKAIASSAQLGATPGYTLLREEYLDDVKSLGLIFRHDKSGARICVLSGDDENKTFCAAFRPSQHLSCELRLHRCSPHH